MTIAAMSRDTSAPDDGRRHGPPTPHGAAGSAPSAGKRPLRHIDDITSVTVDMDPNASVDRALSAAEVYLNQAESSRVFGRPDFALEDYLRAAIILVGIKKNKGWASLQGDNKAQFDKYARIKRRLDSSYQTFENVKAEIKADNARTGVQPSPDRRLGSRGLAELSIGSPPRRMDKGTATANKVASSGRPSSDSDPGTSPALKRRPAVHQKPRALQGNAIKLADGAPRPNGRAVDALTQRFIGLRTAPSSPLQQDPRIRTQSIIGQSATAARSDLPPSPRNSFAAPPSFGLPKMPDAIYSPARGTVSSEAAELPTSTPRGIFSRTNSIAPFPNATGAAKPSSSEDYFALPLSSSNPSAPGKPIKPAIPQRDTLSAQELVSFMRLDSKEFSMLLIDIRSRDEFDEGHIMSQATICVDSEVLMRQDISATEIADSMVLAPALEQLSFERRHEFDLVVFYDQGSTRISPRPETPSERAILGLFNALTQYDFETDSAKRRPKLLAGGLDGWTALMGMASLQASETTAKTRMQSRVPPFGRPQVYRPPPRKRFIARPIQDAEEAKRWEATLNDVESFSPVRSTDDFLRRFPSVTTMQESMAAPITQPAGKASDAFGYGPSRPEELLTSVPPPPQRPAPAVPRPSYSGLAERDNREDHVRVLKMKPMGDRNKKEREFVGLLNPGNWCYANSSLQSMFGTPGFADELCTAEWESLYKAPKKKKEKIEPPQLLAKFLANLFLFMDQGKLEVMEAKTLMQYLQYIHERNMDGTKKPRNQVFGGPCQQDAQEYFSFIIDQLHDETNRLRDRTGHPIAVKDNDPKSLLHNSIEYWREYSALNDSIVDKYWRGLLVQASSCPRCGDHTVAFQVSDLTTLGIPATRRDLESMLADYTAVETPEDYVCEACRCKGRERKLSFARMPDRFGVAFQRFQRNYDSAAASKISHRVTFPIHGLDLSPYCIGPGDRAIEDDAGAASTARDDRHFRGPFLYDCYAVICHIGSDLGSGHYIAYVKDDSSADPTDWVKFDDARVTKIKVGTEDSRDERESMYKSNNQQAYMVFYKRKGT